MSNQAELPIQTESPLFTITPDHPNVKWLIGLLAGAEAWLTAADICQAASRPVSDHNKRWVRTLADRSEGLVAGGQRGYKLVRKMTLEEYQHYRNWMNHQAEEMQRRVIASDRIWYARTPVSV